MAMSDIVPWGRNRDLASQRATEANPFLALHREMNRLFDDVFRGGDLWMPRANWAGNWASTWPNVEVVDDEKQVRVVAELPGVDEKDVEVTLTDGVLTLKGEKKSEVQNALYSERWQGKFERSIQLGPEVDPEKVEAQYKNGVLTITLAKRPEAQSRTKRIPLNKQH
jgi:HSP20 family protein